MQCNCGQADTKQYRAPEGSPGTQNSPGDPAVLKTWVASLNAMHSICLAQRNRLRDAMDVVLGPRPTSGVDLAKSPTAGGVAGEIEMVFGFIGATLNEIDDEIRRLERVVG